MNKWIAMGRLTRDPEIRYTTGETATAIAKFSLAVDRRFKREGQPDADFFNCATFGKQAEFVEKYLRKGTKIVVSGAPQNNNYTDKDGVKHYDIQFVIDEVDFAESKSNSESTSAPKSNEGYMNTLTPEEADELPFA